MTSMRRPIVAFRVCAALATGAAPLALVPPAWAGSTPSGGAAPETHGKPFDGFNDHFNLGRSGGSGAVCEAKRSFDEATRASKDDLIGRGARIWDVTCRGWPGRQGALYLFPGAGTGAEAAWRAGLARRVDCAPPAAGVLTCKTKAGGLDYVALLPRAQGRRVAAEGKAPIAALLAAGARFMTGAGAEPEAVSEQAASVAAVGGARVSELALADQGQSPDARRLEAYRRGQVWRFGDAAQDFSDLATPAADGSTSATLRAEALYNLALNLSNQGRFDEADAEFRKADTLAAGGGVDPAVHTLGLNYEAADARNRGKLEKAVALADQAIAARAAHVQAAPAVADATGAIHIAEQSDLGATHSLTRDEREALRDVQARDIKATALETLGKGGAARDALALALPTLDRPLTPKGAKRLRILGEAAPWLNIRVRADALRLNQGTAGAGEALAQFRLAVAAFAEKYPDSLPLAAYLIELARAESAEAADRSVPDLALNDYERAFDIFRRQRGSLDASADLTRPYFDTLLGRIGDDPAAHRDDVERFFTAAQTLVSQSSAEAALAQAARIRSGDQQANGLGRAVDETARELEAAADRRDGLQQAGLYQGAVKDQTDAQLVRLSADLKLLKDKLHQADPHYALANLVSLTDLQRQLRPGEVYVKVFLLAGRGYGLLVSPSGARPYAIDQSRQALADMVQTLRPVRFDDGGVSDYNVDLAHKVFIALFGPVQADILAARHVIYEPDANVIGAPLAALVVDDASGAAMQAKVDKARTSDAPLDYVGVAWLGARVGSSIALSAPAFVQARAAAPSKAASPFYGFGNPDIVKDPAAYVRAAGLPAGSGCIDARGSLAMLHALPGTEAEVTTVAQGLGQGPTAYALKAAFTDSDIVRRGGPSGDLARFRVLYFATHGIMSSQTNGCLKTALLTSLGGKGSDALLDVGKIPSLNLDADIVVLSACDTGRGPGGNRGEALGGLVTTFVQAGARNLVVSSWEVDSGVTGRLMTAMFAAKGRSQAEALAAAERDLMNRPDQYSNPFFWAPFMVVGDGAKAMPG